MTACEVFEKMNAGGREGSCFLFGLDFELKDGFFVENPLQGSDILFDINGVTNVPDIAYSRQKPEIEILSSDRAGYERGFDVVRKGLERGDSFLLNLTARTEIRLNLSLLDVFMRSRAMYKIYYPQRFVCFSPEAFVRIEGNVISTFPMKGTIDASLPDAEQRLLDDYKETCEHYTIVDLMRNDLNSVAEKIGVSRFRYVDRIRTQSGEILQTSSEVRGTLPDDWRCRIGDIFRALLPAGSISGAPKPSTVSLIRKAEQRDRGFYTGVCGYFDGRNLDSGVMIRFIEQDGGRFFFHSGGGVTINSRCEDEYQEVLEKVYLPFK